MGNIDSDFRNKGIGGSDVAAVLGLSKWKSPLDLFLEKTGLEENEVDNKFIKIGNCLEPLIIKFFEKHKDVKTSAHPPITAEEYDFLRGNLDGVVVEQSAKDATTYPVAVLECKTVNEYARKKWDGIPDEYFLQAQHYMYLTGLKKAYFAVLTVPNAYYNLADSKAMDWTKLKEEDFIDFEVFEYIYDKEYYEGTVIPALVHFWKENVVKCMPPEPINSDDLKKTFYEVEDGQVEIGEDNLDIVEEYAKVLAIFKEVKSRKQEIETQFKLMIRDKTELVHNGLPIATYNEVKSTRFDQKAFKAANPEEYEKYRYTQTTRKFLSKIKLEN